LNLIKVLDHDFGFDCLQTSQLKKSFLFLHSHVNPVQNLSYCLRRCKNWSTLIIFCYTNTYFCRWIT